MAIIQCLKSSLEQLSDNWLPFYEHFKKSKKLSKSNLVSPPELYPLCYFEYIMDSFSFLNHFVSSWLSALTSSIQRYESVSFIIYTVLVLEAITIIVMKSTLKDFYFS